MNVVEQEQWLREKTRFEEVVYPLIEAYRRRRGVGESHPVHDFIFSYYQANRKTLTKWRPPADAILRGEKALHFLDDERYRRWDGGVALDARKMGPGDVRRTEWVVELIEAARSRPARFNCFGMHEWAMVYKTEEIRHEKTPLRLSREAIDALVESLPICCSHHDAFRFFTPEARPFNSMEPGREDRVKNEQFGCVHFNMDLYRWCYKLSPWIGSALLLDCFLLALDARELDMRASPYDIRKYGYEAIAVETPEGREIYAKAQKDLYEKGQLLASRLVRDCRYLLDRFAVSN